MDTIIEKTFDKLLADTSNKLKINTANDIIEISCLDQAGNVIVLKLTQLQDTISDMFEGVIPLIYVQCKVNNVEAHSLEIFGSNLLAIGCKIKDVRDKLAYENGFLKKVAYNILMN